MPKQKLDATFALTAHCPDGLRKLEYRDTIISGFALECRSTGGKTYYLHYTDPHGRQKVHKIGGYGDITFEQARKKAKQLRAEVTLGGNPGADKAEAKTIPTYAILAAQHLEHAKTYQRSYDTTEMYVRRHILPRWKGHLVSEISQQAVASWLAEKTAEGLALATVEKIRVIFGRSFELAMKWDMPAVIKNPTHGIKRPPINNARERYLSAAEFQRLLTALQASRNKQLKFIIPLLVFTGARVSELLMAEWRHLDLEKRQWLIPTSKTGKARHVPLSQPAIDILKAVPKFDKCGYVLPNPKTRKPFTGLKHPWQTARDAAELPDLRIHDLRHSAASFMINAGVDLFAVGRVLGHADHKSTMRYSHLAHDTLLAAVEAGAKKTLL